MKRQFKKIALCVLFSMIATMFAPAAEVAFAAKTFTYAEQKSGDQVTVLFMDPGEKVDLKYIGVPDYKNYTLKWVSSNEKVAVVDSSGLITAIANGTTTIRLNIGNGSVYTSSAVRVYVGEKQEVTIGTSTEEEIKSYVLGFGQKVILKANGIKDMVGDRYTCTWSSTDTSVAKISNTGVVTTVAPGLTVIQLKVTKKHSGEVYEATPIALQVTDSGLFFPTTTPTLTPPAAIYPTITSSPVITATPSPTPTMIPFVSPTVTPVPSGQYIPYTATLESDNCLLLRFSNKVNYTANDIKLAKLTVAGYSVVEMSVEVVDAELSSDGKELRVTPESMFTNGERYIIRAGSADTQGTTLNVVLGAPNRLEVTYSCLGKEGVAYAYNDELPIEVPVTLKYRLYYGNIDVTDTYNTGYITYEFANDKYAESATMAGDSLTFFEANKSIVLRAKYSYYDSNYKLKELNSNSIMIRSEKLPTYGITGVSKYTVASSTDLAIDWEKPVNKVVANSGIYKVVVIIADNYGNYYTNDSRAVDTANNIYSIDDYNSLFSQFGYGLEFKANDPSQVILQPDGTLIPFDEANNVMALVSLTNNGTIGNTYTRSIGVWPITVLEESRLNSIAAEETRITLATDAIAGYEDRFCTGTVEILLKDQYGNKWDSDLALLDLTSTVPEINAALNGTSSAPAWLEGNVLHVDALNARSVTNRISFPLTITETTINRKTTVTVSLQTPTTANGSITTTGWSIGLDDDTIVIGDEAMETLQQNASIEFFKTSSNGVKVGLYENLHLIDSNSYRFTTENCSAGEIYVYVSGPDGKPVQFAGNSGEVGVYVDNEDNCVKVNAFATGSSSSGVMLESLPEGRYNVKATRIVSVGKSVSTAVLSETFSIEDETKEVSFRSIKSTKTPIHVSSSTDLEGVKEVVASVLTFNLDGKEWTTLTKDMITNVEFVMNGKVIVIRSVTFAVPVSNSNISGLSYSKTVTGINKAVTTDASY